MSRPIAVTRWVPYGLLFGLYLTARGYQSFDGDQAYRLPLLLHRQDPSAFADDPFVRAFDAFNPHRGYLALLDLASRPLGLSAGLFALFAATFALTCAGVSRLARTLWPDRGPSVGLLAVALVLLARAGNIGTNHLFEPMLLDRLLGFGLGWVALTLAIEGERWRPSLLVGLAAVIHPSVGLQLGGLLGASWVAWAIASRRTGQSWRSTAVGLAWLTLALIPGAVPNVLGGHCLFEGLSAEEFRRIGVELQMAQHMVPSLWRRPQWLAWGGYLVLGAMALRGGGRCEVPTLRGERVRFALTCAVLLAGIGLAYLMIEVARDLRVTVFQPFRMATIARGLALIAAAGRCVALWRRRDILHRGRVALIAAGLTGDWAFVVAVVVEVGASLGEMMAFGPPLPRSVNGIFHPDRPPQGGMGSEGGRGLAGNPPPLWGRSEWGGVGRCGVATRRLAIALVLATLAYGLLFLSRHDTERGHRALAVALVAAVGWQLIAPGLRPGWTRRRLVFAAAVCGVLPALALAGPACLGRDHPLTRALAARCRFGPIPTDDVERLAVWARSNTPADARFITPPGPKTFRLWSGRSVAFNRAASPYHAAGLKDWSDRFRAHVGFEGTTAEFVRAYLSDRHGLERRYDRLSPEDLARLAAGQGAGYVVAPFTGSAYANHGHRGPLRILEASGRLAIYRVEPPDGCAECRTWFAAATGGTRR